MQTDRQMIEALHDKDMAASKTKDLTILMSLWTDDGVALPPGEDPVIGEEALQAWLQRDLEQDRDYQITEYVHSFEEIEILGEWAFEWGTFSAAAESNAGGPPLRTTGKLLRILKRQPDGTWKVARSIWNNDPPSDGEG